eukprot:10760990-Heterocapsa_arctica.AAC.1
MRDESVREHVPAMRALSPKRVVPAFARLFKKVNKTECGTGVFAVVLRQRAWNTGAPLKRGLQGIPNQPAHIVHKIAPA